MNLDDHIFAVLVGTIGKSYSASTTSIWQVHVCVVVPLD